MHADERKWTRARSPLLPPAHRQEREEGRGEKREWRGGVHYMALNSGTCGWPWSCQNSYNSSGVCRFESNVAHLGFRSASLLKSCSGLVPSADVWNLRHGSRRDYSIRAAEGRKPGFGRQPVKKSKRWRSCKASASGCSSARATGNTPTARAPTASRPRATGRPPAWTARCDARCIGLKKTLVFYTGKAPRRPKTEWIMNEYRLPQNEHLLRKPTCARKDPREVALCRIYKKLVHNPDLCTTLGRTPQRRIQAIIPTWTASRHRRPHLEHHPVGRSPPAGDRSPMTTWTCSATP